MSEYRPVLFVVSPELLTISQQKCADVAINACRNKGRDNLGGREVRLHGVRQFRCVFTDLPVDIVQVEIFTDEMDDFRVETVGAQGKVAVNLV